MTGGRVGRPFRGNRDGRRLKDRLRFPLTFDLPPSTSGRTLIVTAVGTPKFSWEIERVNVYGR